jgi:hypothetical protein
MPAGEWLSVETDAFLTYLDYLVSVEDELWVAGYIRVYQYQEEREAAQVSVLDASEDLIRLEFSADLDTSLFKEPLTLITEVNADWDSCEVVQAGKSGIYVVDDNARVQFEAIPGGGEILLKRYPETVSIERHSPLISGSSLKVNLTASHLNVVIEKMAGKHEVWIFDMNGKVIEKVLME